MIDWLDSHPDVVVPFFEGLDWYNEDIQSYEPIERLADLVYRLGDFDAAKESFDLPTAGSGVTPKDKSIGFKWRVWGDPEAIAAVAARRRVKVFHLFRENLLEMAVSYYFSDIVIPRWEKEHGIDLGGGGHFQFVLAEKHEIEQARYLEIRSRIRFHVFPDAFMQIISDIIAAKISAYDNYCAAFARHGVPVFSVRYEDFVEDQDRFFRRICAELGLDFDRRVPRPPYFKKASSERLLSQVVNLDEIANMPELRAATATIHSLIYERHRYLFDQP